MSAAVRGRNGPAGTAAVAVALAILSAASPVASQEAPRESAPAPAVTPGAESAALARYRERAEESDRPRDWYNLGAALLASGDWEGAIPPLERALVAREEEVEEPVTYNLGLALALGGRPPPADAEAGAPAPLADADDRRLSLLRARDAFRWVLRANPRAEDARWNLELVDRWLRQESPPASGGGGGGGGAEDEAGGGGGGGGAGQGRLSPEDAQALLDAAAAEEQEVQSKRLERNRVRDPVVPRNW